MVIRRLANRGKDSRRLVVPAADHLRMCRISFADPLGDIMGNGTIRIKVPAELGEALIAEGVATEATGRRSSGWELAVDLLGPVTMAISLLQAPQTVSDVAGRIRRLLQRSERTAGDAVVIDAVGPYGQARRRFPADATAEEIMEFLEATIMKPDGDGRA
jgi:hypothetical protein